MKENKDREDIKSSYMNNHRSEGYMVNKINIPRGPRRQSSVICQLSDSVF